MMHKKQAFPFISSLFVALLVCLLVWVALPMQTIIQKQAYRLFWQIGITGVMSLSCLWVFLAWRQHNLIWNALQTDGTWPLIEPVMSDCAKAMAVIKKQYGVWKSLFLNQCPWIILVGAQGAGKTSLLANAGLALEAIGDSTLKSALPTSSVDFWVGDRVLLADVSGQWCWGEKNSVTQQMWRNVLKRWQCFRSKKAHTTAVVVLDCASIQRHDKKAWREYVGKLSRQCQVIQSIIPNVHFTFVLSKADSLLGFSAFFSLLSLEERQQLCGVSVTSVKGQAALKSITNSLKSLLQRIDRLTINRLHQEQNVLRRDLLRAFPQRLAMFVEEFTTLVEAMPGQVQGSVMGIYLTSSEQQDPSEDHTIGSALVLDEEPIVGSRPYFVRELFANLVKRGPHHLGSAVRWHWTVYHILIGSAVILTGVFFLHQGFVKTQLAIEEAKAILAQPAEKKASSGPAWLPQLKALSHVKEALLSHRLIRYRWLGYSEGEELIQTANQRYQSALKVYLLPHLSGLFEQVIRKDWEASPIDPRLFHDLSMYEQWLSLPSHDSDKRFHYLELVWDRLHWSLDQKQAFIPHVKALLAAMPNSFGDQHVLQEAKNVLLSLPREEVAWMVVRSQFMDSDALMTKALGNTFNISAINRLFLPSESKQVKQSLIPKAIEELAREETVLGKALFLSEEDSDVVMIDAVYQYYLRALDAYWYERLRATPLLEANQLPMLRLQLHDLTDTHSPLWVWLNQLMSVLDQSHDSMSHVSFWNQLRAFTASGEQQELFSSIASKVDTLLSACGSPEATFQQAKAQLGDGSIKDPVTLMNTLAGMMADPLQHWFQTLSHRIWQSMFDLSGQYISEQWQKQVYTEYSDKLQGRYPLAPASSPDIKRGDFDHFFAPGGTMQHFFEAYLLPFVNVEDASWSLKKRADTSLSLSQDRLDMILRSSTIQKMFYQNDHKKEIVKFSVLPEKVSEAIQFLHFDVAGQEATLYPTQREAFDAQWPNRGDDYARLQVFSKDGNTLILRKKGPWAWLRLVGVGKLKVTKDPKTYELIWSLGAHQIPVQLRADQATNPYEPDVLASFQLWPDVLLEEAGTGA